MKIQKEEYLHVGALLAFLFVFFKFGLEGDGEALEFFDGAPGNDVGVEFEVEHLGEGIEHAETVEPGKATVDKRNYLWLTFAGDVYVDDAAQLFPLGGDDLAADKVLNAYDGATGVR
jgi:hypothetical protein